MNLKLPNHVSVSEHVNRVRNSHLAVLEGIATKAEKHRDEMNRKREAARQSEMLETSHGHTAG